MNFLIPIYIFFTTLGITLMKFGGDSLSISVTKNFTFSIGWITMLGFLSYIVSFLLWQRILISSNISTVFAITTGIIQICVFTIGILLFKENFKIIHLAGIGLIISGITLLVIK